MSLPVKPEQITADRDWRRRSAVKYAEKQRAELEIRQDGNRGVVRRLPVQSAKRRREQRERSAMLLATFGTDPLCVYPDCCAFADDAHEVLSRARGGSITDPSNIRPLCREHHTFITEHPAEAAALGLSISAFGGNA